MLEKLTSKNPDYYNYQIGRKEFEKAITTWFKEKKKITVHLKTSFEDADDYGSLGSYYFGFDTEKTSDEAKEKLIEMYGYGLDHVNIDFVLKDVYKKKVRTDFNPYTEEIYLFVPYTPK